MLTGIEDLLKCSRFYGYVPRRKRFIKRGEYLLL